MSDFRYLVFGGGGAAGYAYVGALRQLAKEPKFSFANIKGVAGTSVGAVAALIVSLNFPLEEASEKLAKMDLKKLADSGCFIKKTYRLFSKYGMYKGDAFASFINDIITERTGRSDPENVTFADLKALGCKDLYIVATKLYLLNGNPTGKQKIFSTEKTPNTSVSAAIRASAAAPFYFSRIRLKKEDKKTYVLNDQGDLYEDGGVLNNFPIELFDKEELLPQQKTPVNRATLGVALYNPKNQGDQKPKKEVIADGQPKNYVYGLFNSLLHQVNHTKLNEAMNMQRTIHIDRKGVKLNDFTMSQTTKDLLIQSGEDAVKRFFANYRELARPVNDPNMVEIKRPSTLPKTA